jgi:hypothetical protein
MHKLDIPVIGATLGLAMLLVLVVGSLASSPGHVRLAAMPPRTMVAADPGGSLAPCSLLIERSTVAGRVRWRPKRPDCP